MAASIKVHASPDSVSPPFRASKTSRLPMFAQSLPLYYLPTISL
jgi:hypothetical protein